MTTTERELLAESVHATLREQIFAGELPPGTALSVPALASRLNVSRTPVREAVQQLINDGLAVYTRNAGAKVETVDEGAVLNCAQEEAERLVDLLGLWPLTGRTSNQDTRVTGELTSRPETLQQGGMQ